MLDDKFQMAYNLTYNTMATHKDVDTSMLRRAIWNYIHCMFGIRWVPLRAKPRPFPALAPRHSFFVLTALLFLRRYDDYDYGEINQLLDRSFKVYIKTMVCSPEKTTKRMYESFWRQFQHSEKVRRAPDPPAQPPQPPAGMMCCRFLCFFCVHFVKSLFFCLCSPPQVHVNLLLMEARMQAELLYALRAITRYMT